MGFVDATRIAALVAPFLEGDTLSGAQLAQLASYLDLLLRWNARINLTAVRDPEEIVTRHFGESLFAAHHLLPRGEALPGGSSQSVRGETGVAPSRAVEQPHKLTAEAPMPMNDVGSGAGFPGLPIKIWSPALRVVLIESQNKKQTFLREVIRALDLRDVDVFAGRAEELDARSDLVTMRAVEKFERALPVAERLVAPGGRLALLIGAGQEAAATNLARHLEWSRPLPVPLSTSRVLLVGTKPRRQESAQ